MFTWPDWLLRLMDAYAAIPRWARYTIAALVLVVIGGVLL